MLRARASKIVFTQSGPGADIYVGIFFSRRLTPKVGAGHLVSYGRGLRQPRSSNTAASHSVGRSIARSGVQAHREAIGDVTDLKGYQARKARNELATTFAVALPGQETADPSVIKACSGLLDKRNT